MHQQSSRQEEDFLQQIKEKKYQKEDDVTSLRRKNKAECGSGSKDDNEGEGELEDEDEDGVEGEEGPQEEENNGGEDEDGNSKRQVSHGHHLVEGRMGHGMEDFIVAENRIENGHELGLYAIFDGHSGRKVAQYLQHYLFHNILSEPDFWTNPERAIKRAFKKTDDEVLEGVVGSKGGSTAVTAILIDRKKLIVANVGDSRAILCRNGEGKPITADHKLEKEEEKELVESKGGAVIIKPGNIPRVDGQLAMTRAFGDEKLKEHITSEPDIFVVKIDSSTDFIVLASDGLWKVMSNQDAADCIMDVKDAQEASKELIEEALARKSADDISCLVVRFQ